MKIFNKTLPGPRKLAPLLAEVLVMVLIMLELAIILDISAWKVAAIYIALTQVAAMFKREDSPPPEDNN